MKTKMFLGAIIFIPIFFVLFAFINIVLAETTGEEISSGRAVKIIETTREKAGIKEAIRLVSYKEIFCGNLLKMGVADGIDRDVAGRVTIKLGSCFIEFASDLALQGVLNHEIGHLVNGDVDRHASGQKRWMDLTREEINASQEEADKFAISVVGKDAVNAYLNFQGLASRY